jgi:pectate lyase-like protein
MSKLSNEAEAQESTTATGVLPEIARREIAAFLFGAAGLAAFNACAPSSGTGGVSDPTARLSQAVLTGSNFLWFDTIAGTTQSLRSVAGSDAGGGSTPVAVVGGYASPNDGGGGLFYWSTSAGTDNGGTIIVPPGPGSDAGDGGAMGASGPCWKRIYSGLINVKWFGAVGDNSTDNSAAFTAAAALGVSLYFPAGQYKFNISGGIPVSNYMTIQGDGYASTGLYQQAASPAINANNVSFWSVRQVQISSGGHGIRVGCSGSTQTANASGIIEDVWIYSVGATARGISVEPFVQGSVTGLVFFLTLRNVVIGADGVTGGVAGFLVDLSSGGGAYYTTWTGGQVNGATSYGINAAGGGFQIRGVEIQEIHNSSSTAVALYLNCIESIFDIGLEASGTDVYLECASGAADNEVNMKGVAQPSLSQIVYGGTRNKIRGSYGGGPTVFSDVYPNEITIAGVQLNGNTLPVTIGQAGLASNVPTNDLVFLGQAPNSGATGSNRNSGAWRFDLPTPVSGGSEGMFKISRNGTLLFGAQPYPSNPAEFAFYGPDAVGSPGTSNYWLYRDTSGTAVVKTAATGSLQGTASTAVTWTESSGSPQLGFYGATAVSQAARAGQLTDNSGGTASATIAVVPSTYSQSELANALASLAKKINALETIIHSVGLSA